MQVIVNLEETPGKVVGRRQPSLDDYDRMVDRCMALDASLPFPKGVFRFRTHEEADAWTNHYILKAAVKKPRGSQSAAT